MSSNIPACPNADGIKDERFNHSVFTKEKAQKLLELLKEKLAEYQKVENAFKEFRGKSITCATSSEETKLCQKHSCC